MELARLVREKRRKKSMSEPEMGRLIKPRNPGRGVEYVRAIESGAMPFPPLWALKIIAAVLELDRAGLFAALKSDFEEQNRLFDTLELEIRYPDGWSRRETLPEGTSPEEAIQIMRENAAAGAPRCTVMLSRLREITVYGDGTLRERYRFPAGCGLKVRNGLLVPPETGTGER